MSRKTFPVRTRAFSLSCATRCSSPLTSPPRTVCFDIFSPPPGDSDVISQLDRLNSNETKIAPRSVRIAVGASGWSAVTFMVSSKMGGGSNPLTLPGKQSLPPTRHGILKRSMGRPTRKWNRGRLTRMGEMSEEYAPLLHRGSGGGMYTRKAHATREAPMRDQG